MLNKLLKFVHAAAIAFSVIIFTSTTHAASGVVINEIAWMGSTVSTNDEWIELYNPTDYTVNIDGWRLKATNGSPNIVLQGTIPAGGYFLLERTNDQSVPIITANQIYGGSLGNDGEKLILTDANAVIQDEIDASSGWPAGDAKTKQTMERNLNLANWHTGPVNGTPLAKNTIVTAIISPPTSTKNKTSQPEANPLSAEKINLQQQDLLAGIGTNDPQQFTNEIKSNKNKPSLNFTPIVVTTILLFTLIFGSAFIFRQLHKANEIKG